MSVLTFQIYYGTQNGERLRLHFRTSRGSAGYVMLETSDRYCWQGELETEAGAEWISHTYEVVRGDDVVRRESGACRHIHLEKRSRLHLLDAWTDAGIPPVFLHSAFTSCVFSPTRGRVSHGLLAGRYLFLLNALPAPAGFRWGISGSSERLGAWNPRRAVPLERTDTYEWGYTLQPEDFDGECEYKIVLLNEATPERPLWERGENRRIPRPVAGSTDGAVFVCASSPRFNLPPWHGAGVVVPVGALRGRGSQGIGDFGDLQRFCDWAAGCGLSAVQLLPLYDTDRTDGDGGACPYNAVSAFALNPAFLDLRRWRELPLAQPYLEEGARLNTSERLDYASALHLKLRFLREFYRLQGRHVTHSGAFRRFTAENSGWLGPYARWREAHATPAERKADAALKPEADAATHSGAGYVSFEQFLLHSQLLAAHRHARSLGLVLKGDIPMGVTSNGVAATQQPKLFHAGSQTGAPPDDFSAEGQNWGFPTYDWDAMAQDGFLWWRRRLAHAGRYFDAFRLDHALGFFRIWEIPSGQRQGVMGHFRPSRPLSGPEIASAGFTLPVYLYTRPHLSARRLAQLSEQADGAALDAFFQKEGGYFTLRPEVSDQRGVLAHVRQPRLRKLLMDLVADVLFVEDPDYAGCYHPRIAARRTTVYRTLPPEAQRAYDALSRDYFTTRHEALWRREATTKLHALFPPDAEGTPLPCAEDLGMAPRRASDVLRSLGILTLEVQTLPPAPQQAGDAPFAAQPYLSVNTPSTHDMAPLRLCWQLNRAAAAHCWVETLRRDGPVPADLPPEACRELLKLHLESPGILCLVSWQDLLAMDGRLRAPEPATERINDPAAGRTPDEAPSPNWTWRMHLTIEDLFAATDFNERLRNLLRLTGRG